VPKQNSMYFFFHPSFCCLDDDKACLCHQDFRFFPDKWVVLQERELPVRQSCLFERENLENLLSKKINSVRYPMQELELVYPKGKMCSDEDDWYLLCH